MLSSKSEKDVNELYDRMMDAFIAGGGRGLEFQREAFVPGDFETLHAAVQEVEPSVQKLIVIWNTVSKQLARGERCAVCGYTQAQSEAINYDCSNEC